MKELHSLTDLQLTLLEVLWRRGEATATDVHDELVYGTSLARKTIGTLLSRLEKQEVVEHRVEGREFVYRPVVSREEVRRATVDNLLQRLFSGNLPALVSHALESDEIESGDVERVRELISEWQRREEES